MKKGIIFAVICCLAAGVALAASKTAPKTTAKTAKKEVKPTMEFVVVEADGYAAGKADIQAINGLANSLGGEAKINTLTADQAKQEDELATFEYNFLPFYFVKKTPELRKKLEQYLNAGYLKETEKYLVFGRLSRTGVFVNKEAKPNVLEVFVMSQCPYGVMAEGLIINAKKEGKIPADKIIKLRYIVNYDEKTNQFQSLHGSGEWEEDVRQLLIAKYYPEKFWKYVEVRNKDYRSSRWDKAMEEAGINVKKIMKKFDTEGVELLKAEAAYGNEYEINASPSFLWEGKELLDFGSVSQKPGLEFMNPAQSKPGAAAPAGSC